jgi:hypothetical protein
MLHFTLLELLELIILQVETIPLVVEGMRDSQFVKWITLRAWTIPRAVGIPN